jgi:tripartite-type tricarboxylate transporter receptor subunit TctC
MKARILQPKIFFFLCLALVLLFPGLGYSQEEIAKFPSRPINFIIALPPGAGLDLACRLICKEAEKFLGQAIIPVNKPWGGFTIGTAAIAFAKPDGYTIGCAGHPAVFAAPHMEKLPYHPVKDIKWIMQFGFQTLGISVRSDSPFKSFKDLINYARQNPDKLIYGHTGVGSFGHIAMEQIAKKEGVRFSPMPFKGAEMFAALLGGHVHVATGDANYALIEARQTRPLALIADSHPIEYPQTPILKDLGYDIPAPAILNVSGPKDLPEGIARKLEEAFTKAMKEEAFIQGMKDLHHPIFYRNSKELSDYVSRNYETYGKFLKEMGLAQ